MSIQSELEALKAENGELLTAEHIVEWAKSHPKSALYHAPQFCGWDIKKSAYHHWVWGARALVAMHLRYEEGGRKFISLSIDRQRDGGGYRAIDDVLRDQMLHEIMLQDALNELGRIQVKYDRLKQLKPVWRAAAKIKATRKKKGETERPSKQA